MTHTEIIALIDLTRLQEDDQAEHVSAFCQQAVTPLGPVAAVCVYAQFIDAAKKALHNTSIPIATVANFPTGNEPLDTTLAHIKNSIAAGAREIDVVMPYTQLMQGQTHYVSEFLTACRDATLGHTLKVIIESGALTPHLIHQATSIVAAIGADFVKTSTGKLEHGASLPAVETILQTLSTIENAPGIKISGGVRSPEQARDYLELITRYMGSEWVHPHNVRLGASQLLERLLN